MKSVTFAPIFPSSWATLYLRSYSHMKYMNPPPPAPDTFPPMAPVRFAASYMASMWGLETLVENCFLNVHPSSRISPAVRMSPRSNATDISLARALVLSRASSFCPLLNLSTWLSMMVADSRLLPV